MRLGCSGGVTGDVLAPTIDVGASEIVVTFDVAPLDSDLEQTCPGNDEVEYEVDLGEPIGQRSLLDGACRDGRAAASTTFCSSGAVRWAPPSTESVDDDDAVTGGIDGPVMYGARQEEPADQMAAEIIGTLELDGDCLYTTFDGIRYLVLFPYGTSWDDTSSRVVLPDGSVIGLGGDVHGGGGYLKPDTIDLFTSDPAVLERAQRCAEEPYFEVAVMQSN